MFKTQIDQMSCSQLVKWETNGFKAYEKLSYLVDKA